jgi:hypothetical protein
MRIDASALSGFAGPLFIYFFHLNFFCFRLGLISFWLEFFFCLGLISATATRGVGVRAPARHGAARGAAASERGGETFHFSHTGRRRHAVTRDGFQGGLVFFSNQMQWWEDTLPSFPFSKARPFEIVGLNSLEFASAKEIWLWILMHLQVLLLVLYRWHRISAVRSV